MREELIDAGDGVILLFYYYISFCSALDGSIFYPAERKGERFLWNEKKNCLVCKCYHVSHLIFISFVISEALGVYSTDTCSGLSLCLSLCSCFFWYTMHVLNLFLMPRLLSLMVLIMRCLDNEHWKLWTGPLETVSVCSGIHRLVVTTGLMLTCFLVQDLNA